MEWENLSQKKQEIYFEKALTLLRRVLPLSKIYVDDKINFAQQLFNWDSERKYTGCKDKNGQRIYEGQKVKWFVNGLVCSTGKVIFEFGSYWVALIDIVGVGNLNVPFSGLKHTDDGVFECLKIIEDGE
jgi:hypothetical protein